VKPLEVVEPVTVALKAFTPVMDDARQVRVAVPVPPGVERDMLPVALALVPNPQVMSVELVATERLIVPVKP
jgi:hypothetical protein